MTDPDIQRAAFARLLDDMDDDGMFVPPCSTLVENVIRRAQRRNFVRELTPALYHTVCELVANKALYLLVTQQVDSQACTQETVDSLLAKIDRIQELLPKAFAKKDVTFKDGVLVMIDETDLSSLMKDSEFRHWFKDYRGDVQFVTDEYNAVRYSISLGRVCDKVHYVQVGPPEREPLLTRPEGEYILVEPEEALVYLKGLMGPAPQQEEPTNG